MLSQVFRAHLEELGDETSRHHHRYRRLVSYHQEEFPVYPEIGGELVSSEGARRLDGGLSDGQQLRRIEL